MTKIIATSDLASQLATILTWLANNEAVILETDGTAQAALIPIADYEQWQTTREQPRRPADVTADEHDTVAARLAALQMQVSGRNQDLTTAEADALAAQFVREVVEDLVAESKMPYRYE